MVGRPYRSTPVFSYRMTYLVLNPSGEVRPRQDQLPLIKRGPKHIERMGSTVLCRWGAAEELIDPKSADWMGLSARNLSYRLPLSPAPIACDSGPDP